MHFYIHSQPPPPPELARADVVIPAPIAIPLVAVSEQLRLPVVITYSDDVLYNWALKNPTPAVQHITPVPTPSLSPDLAYRIHTPLSPRQPSTPFSAAYFTPLTSPLPEEELDSTDSAPALDNLRSITLFTGTSDEEEFYLSSARCELAGVAALDAMRTTMDELFVGDEIARRRISRYLYSLSGHIDEIAKQLLGVRNGCSPEAFYHDIRPWFNGQDSGPNGRKWVFEGVPAESQPKELSGPSAGQSSLVHALDIFLGVSDYSHEHGAGDRKEGPSFLDRMQTYMPRHHRAFLQHLASAPRPLRAVVEAYSESDPELSDAYNSAVSAMKRFRDSHMRIVALYIMGPARREREAQAALAKAREDAAAALHEKKPLKGTGGTDLVHFLKGVRDRTASAIIGH
jgi:indoleamine 2,3-dioxygenase